MSEIELCPCCGFKPVIGYGKKTGCQMHGEPMQAVTVSCTRSDCFAKPSVSAGNIWNGGKAAARQEAIALWNKNVSYTGVGKLRDALKACCEVLTGGTMSKRSLTEALELARAALNGETK